MLVSSAQQLAALSAVVRPVGAMIPCLQRACRLRHTVAGLAVLALRGRRTRRLVGACCGQDCGQPEAARPCGDHPGAISAWAAELGCGFTSWTLTHLTSSWLDGKGLIWAGIRHCRG